MNTDTGKMHCIGMFKIDDDLLDYMKNKNNNSTVFVLTVGNTDDSGEVLHLETKEIQETSKIQDILLNIGIPTNVIGYSFIVRALQMISENPDYLKRITKGLYKDIAEEFSSTPSRVERNIRHAIELGFSRGYTDLINDIFGWTIDDSKGIPTNSQFLSSVFLYLNKTQNY